MIGLSDQVWVTSAVSDNDVEKALVLCYSLRRAYTSRKVAVIASPKISIRLRQALNYGFDFVFYLEEDQNCAHLKLGDFAKLYSLVALRSFKNCAYVSPSMLALKNCDDIFSESVNSFLLLENGMDTSVFLFKPSINHFEALTLGLRQSNKNGDAGIGAFLYNWAKNQSKITGFLDGKYNNVMTSGKALLGYEQGISLVNLLDYPKISDMAKLETTGILGKLVAIHWQKIHQDDVAPLLGLSSGRSSAIISSTLPTVPRYCKEPVAIVGMSCRFPGSNNLEEFWNLLSQGEDGTSRSPPFRWLREQCSRHCADAKKTNAGFLKVPVDEFDAKFFGISPKEVLFMDPQHRLLHEIVWEGLEDACIDPHELRGSSGSVFIGSWLNDYKDIIKTSGDTESYRLYMGNSIGAAAARISFLLGMTGPSIATESGCSSAMVALHLACRSLQLGETNLAVAGGVNLLLHPFDKDEMPMVVSPDGRCKTFSEDANGFARAEGCGVLVLKRLSDALKDGDNVWGLIRGSAVSQEGISKSMGTPTVHCESLAMKEALIDANVSPEEVSYVETHGTGTVVGDPMEVAAIAKAYNSPSRKTPLIIGSVKTNVGHTESCSGITGIMKIILAFHHEKIPAHRNFTKLNPTINLDAVPAIIPLESVDWKKCVGKPRIAGVSSFGITGTDAHAIIEEPPEISISKTLAVGAELDRPLHVLKISAKTEEALNLLLTKYRDTLESSDDTLADISYSTNTGRASFANRAVILASSKENAISAIEQHKYLKAEVQIEEQGKICFLFTGQGSQYPGMAKKLYETSPVFQMHFDYCEKILKDTYNVSIKNVLWSSACNSHEISRTIYSQTSIFCVEYALLKLWESWGVKPDYALGHSLGEFAAAVCAGVICVEDAIKLVAERSQLIDALPRGKMLVIRADHNEVKNKMKIFAGDDQMKLLDYAAINSNQQTVVAGDSDMIVDFSQFCINNNLKCIMLEATHAFHSKHMDPMLEKYRQVAKTTRILTSQKCEYISGMKGNVVPLEKVDEEYWVQHTREKVNFLDASKKAVELGCQIFIEIGPQPVLSALTMMNNDAPLLCLPSLKRKENEWETILTTVAKLYLKGVDIDWNGFDQFYNRRKVRLPHYPFIGKKFWPDMMQVTGNVIHPLVGSIIPNASSIKLFQCGVNLRTHEYIKDHAIGQTVVFPGAGYLEMCLAAGLATVEGSTESLGKPSRPMKVENLMIQAPLALEDGKTCQVQTVVELNTSKENQNDWNDVTVKIYHRVESELSSSWLQHAIATFSPIPSAEEQIVQFNKVEFLEVLGKPSNDEIISKAYEKLATIGLKFGPVFRSLERLWKNEENNTLLAKVKIPSQNDGQPNQYILHPAVLDAMIQAIMMMKLTSNLKRKLYVPIKIGKFLWLSNSLNDESEDRYIHVLEKAGTTAAARDPLSTCDSTALLIDSTGKILAIMSEVEFIDTTVKAVESVLEQQTSTMPQFWEESWRPKLGPLQHRHDTTICSIHKFYDDAFMEDIKEKYNKLSPELEETFRNLERMVFLNMIRGLYQCGWTPRLNVVLKEEELLKQLKIKPEFRQMFGYFLRVLQDEGILDNMGPTTWKVVSIPPSLHDILEELSSPCFTVDLVKTFNPTLLLAKVGENLSAILQGTESALAMLFPEEGSKWPSVAGFYSDYGDLFAVAEMGATVVTAGLECCKRHYSSERNVFRVLEIGAGTGAFTKTFLENFVGKLGMETEYTFTDISPSFFAPAEKKFAAHLKYMTFKKLDIEEDPVSQGFIPNYYDWIVASDVIHATKSLSETLRNTRMLLRPGGRFDMQEMTKVNRFITYLFGLLDGFWRFEDFDVRQNHCTLSTAKWIETLELAGFDVIDSFPSVHEHHSYICTYKANDSVLAIPKPEIPKKNNKIWIIFHQDDSPISTYLLEQIPRVDNRSVITVRRGSKFQALKNENAWEFVVRQDTEEDFVQVMQSVVNGNEVTSIEGVVYCWSLDKSCTAQDVVLQPYFYVVKAMLQLKNSLPKLVALLNGIMPVDGNELSHLYPSTVWGFTKSLRNERIDLNCRCIDIGGREDNEGVQQVYYEIWNTDKETQVAYIDNTRHIAKIQPVKPVLSDLKLPAGTDRFQLILPETKAINDLQFGPLAPIILEDGEIEIQIRSSALNFRDVFSVLKPSEKFKNINAVGFDFAGVIKRTGPNVSLWSVGDHVFGVNVNGAALPSHIKLNENDVLRVPDDMTLSDACTLPAVVATSYHCLIDVAKLTAEDTILIHAASGGVGLSAIEICKNIGATIIATAGSKRKQNYLRSLGIQHVFHSRNTEYGEEILKVTNGRGVDVVLNSLTSEGFKEATLKACSNGARFVEMSKLSIWEPEEVEKLRPDVKYTIVDVSSMDTKEWRRLMTTLRQLAEQKIVNPIPYVRFDGIHIREALQYMQKAKHIGKVVCIMPEIKLQHGSSEVYTSMFNENATYLITGGLGGIGFVVCQWMVKKGAKHVLLAGRSLPTEVMQQSISKLNSEYNARVQAVQLDVGNFSECKELIQVKLVEMGLPSLRGIMHAAGTLNDSLIENQTWEKLSSTFNSKVCGTHNLHLLTKDLNLEHFVLFSSIAALFGSPGQCNHSAGNTFEDIFAHYRNQIGLPATSVNWGQWGETGIATEAELPGMKPFSNLQGVTGLEYALKSQSTQICAVNIDSFVLLSKLFPRISSSLDERVWKSGNSGAGTNVLHLKSDEFWQQYDTLPNIEEKAEMIREKLRFILKSILKLDETDVIEDNANFQEIGVDSLMFVEIKNGIQTLLGDRATVNASAMRDCNTLKLLSDAMVKVIEGDELEEDSIPTAEEVAQLIEKDCKLPESIRARSDQVKTPIKDISKVLLTGCTGTLGPYILRELCKTPQVTQIVCLMRPYKNISGENRLRKILEERDLLSQVDMLKVNCVEGNVSVSNLGLEPIVWEELCNNIDAIFHCAASVQHMEHYKERQSDKDMRAVNVGGTNNVLEFACTGNKLKQVYLASSLLAVAAIDKQGNFSEDWPEPHDYDGVTTFAYPITKFVGDMLLKQAVLERGIPGKSFRFPLIVGDSRTGRFLLDQNHIMLRYLFILKTGLMPSNPLPIIMLPVDMCAWASVKLFFNPNAPDDIYNISNNPPDSDQEFTLVAQKLGYKVDIVEFSEFTQRIRETTADDSPFAIFKEFYKDDQDLMSMYNSAPILRQWVLEGCTTKDFMTSKKIPALLPEFFNDKAKAMDHVYRDMQFAKQHGWLEKYTL